MLDDWLDVWWLIIVWPLLVWLPQSTKRVPPFLIIIVFFCFFLFFSYWYILPRPRNPRARRRFVFAQPKFLEGIFTSIVNLDLEQHACMTSTSSGMTLTSTQLSMISAPLATSIGRYMPAYPRSRTTLRRRWGTFYRVISRHPHQHFRPSYYPALWSTRNTR